MEAYAGEFTIHLGLRVIPSTEPGQEFTSESLGPLHRLRDLRALHPSWALSALRTAWDDLQIEFGTDSWWQWEEKPQPDVHGDGAFRHVTVTFGHDAFGIRLAEQVLDLIASFAAVTGGDRWHEVIVLTAKDDDARQFAVRKTHHLPRCWRCAGTIPIGETVCEQGHEVDGWALEHLGDEWPTVVLNMGDADSHTALEAYTNVDELDVVAVWPPDPIDGSDAQVLEALVVWAMEQLEVETRVPRSVRRQFGELVDRAIEAFDEPAHEIRAKARERLAIKHGAELKTWTVIGLTTGDDAGARFADSVEALSALDAEAKVEAQYGGEVSIAGVVEGDVDLAS